MQGACALIVDRKLGRWRVGDPDENWQLKIYAVLLSRSEPQLEEITVAVQSPYFRYSPYTFGRDELDRIYEAALIVLDSLSGPPAPTPGSWCTFCPAKMLCPAARNEAENATLAKVIELPLGEPAAKLLTQIRRAQSLFKEIEVFYRRVLEREPGAVPGWTLEPGVIRRSVEDPVATLQRLIDTLSVTEFVGCCAPSIPELERAFAKKKGLSAAKAREQFSRCMNGLITEKRTAPSLKAI